MYTAVEKKNRGVQFEWVLVECWWDLYNLFILYSETYTTLLRDVFPHFFFLPQKLDR